MQPQQVFEETLVVDDDKAKEKDILEIEALRNSIYVGCKVHAKQHVTSLMEHIGTVAEIQDDFAKIEWESGQFDWISILPGLIQSMDTSLGTRSRRQRTLH